jgi:hypothetical protein
MRYDADMLGNAADLSDVADMQRDLQYNRDLLRLHYVCVGEHLSGHANLYRCINLPQSADLPGWRDLSRRDDLPQCHVRWCDHLSGIEYLSGLVHLSWLIDLSQPVNLHRLLDVRRHCNMPPDSHVRSPGDLRRLALVFWIGSHMCRSIHMSRLDHLPGSENLPRNGHLYRFDDLPELAHLHLDFDLSGQPDLQGHYHL